MSRAPDGPRLAAQELYGRRWWLVCGLVLAVVLMATVPTTGDIGLTWDEPAYRYSQLISAQWWEHLAHAGSWKEIRELLTPDALLYYWPYGRHGINFHPPLAGQLSLASYELFGRWMKDIPARRLASVVAYALTITLGFGFLTRRYGAWVGGVMVGALLLMPRVYGDGHLAGTDTPGMFLWAATALAFWKGLYEPEARTWRVLVGVLLGLGFVEKMAAVAVLGPLLAWLVAVHLPRTLVRRGGRADWIDGILTTVAMLVPLAMALLEIRRLASQLPPPARTNLFLDRPASALPGAVLAVPLAVWIIRRWLGRIGRAHPVWGAERPALETWTAILAFAPVVGWLGNPAWWRETLPRLAHYAMLSGDRRGALPDIQILYLGRTYIYSLPWHNAWVWIAITVPAGILAASLAGVVYTLCRLGSDRLPLYFLVHLATLPVLRMLPTPAHDGVRLLLPTFFFLAASAGWGAAWVADGLARLTRLRATWSRLGVSALVLGTAAWQLALVHPFELSYYNELIGGPRGAWNAGFELSYWYDAFNDRTLEEINRRLPPHAAVDSLNERTKSPTFHELQTLGVLRSDLELGTRSPDEFPYAWLLTHDSKASAFTRLLFAMTPWYARAPRQLDGLRVVTVADPVAVSRAWALFLLASGPDAGPSDQDLSEHKRNTPPEDFRSVRTGVPPGVSSARPQTRPLPARAPGSRRRDPGHPIQSDSSKISPGGPQAVAPSWVRRYVPLLGRFWGEGLTMDARPGVNDALFHWARTDPKGLRLAARRVAGRLPVGDDRQARQLLAILCRFDRPGEPGGLLSQRLLRARPEALVEAVTILIDHPDAVRSVLTRASYTDPELIGGFLDRDLDHPAQRWGVARSAARVASPIGGSALVRDDRFRTSSASPSAPAAIAAASQ